ncbi:hypothetical protein L686_19205 [Stutzerimonas stutzeri MF28]|nr:hypothetical protein L686_19205 [Stutzerimonas stutzeri MF28]
MYGVMDGWEACRCGSAKGYAKAIRACRQRLTGPALYLITLNVAWRCKAGGVTRVLEAVCLGFEFAWLRPLTPALSPEGRGGVYGVMDGWEAGGSGRAKVEQRGSGYAGNDPHGQLRLREGAGPEGSRMAWQRRVVA